MGGWGRTQHGDVHGPLHGARRVLQSYLVDAAVCASRLAGHQQSLVRLHLQRNTMQLLISCVQSRHELNRDSTHVPTCVPSSGCIHSSRPNWFIIHMKRSDTCSRFPAIKCQCSSYQRIQSKAACRHVSLVRLNSQSDYFVYF